MSSWACMVTTPPLLGCMCMPLKIDTLSHSCFVDVLPFVTWEDSLCLTIYVECTCLSYTIWQCDLFSFVKVLNCMSMPFKTEAQRSCCLWAKWSILDVGTFTTFYSYLPSATCARLFLTCDVFCDAIGDSLYWKTLCMLPDGWLFCRLICEPYMQPAINRFS